MTEDLMYINNKWYYIDIAAMSEFIKISPEDLGTTKKSAKALMANDINPSSMINVTKYEMVKLMLDTILNMGFSLEDTGGMDDTEKLIKGVSNDGFENMPIPFKIAFNTLIINKIIKAYEPTNRENKRSDSKIKR